MRAHVALAVHSRHGSAGCCLMAGREGQCVAYSDMPIQTYCLFLGFFMYVLMARLVFR